ncbi:leukocyte immunoglobulin-like receptor subfamily A member 2 isoform X2 [Numida meleagris]|uniref:leukocyte immunoglobulin-like receptor subfamily A member 2 isoform X2 n=1 Tax=Numida meleagris TaxID=8996 RepID=UPI000B3E26E6|nr:leukocyte immunoglobulin-like receptor subfamily A member 2 isoform X2 [Numida meleagris]
MSSCPKAELAGAFWSLPVPTAVSLSPSCSCLMAPMALALILGSCLVAVSRAKHLPRPSLSLHPSQGVSLGDSVTLRCHLPSLAARVMLYQNRQWRTEKEKEKGQTTVEFSFLNTKWTDMGVYQCQYRVLDPPGTSEISDPVELLVTDPSYPQPGISLSPEEQVRTGTNVTIQCWNQGYQGTIFLHKDGHSAPVQRQDPDGIGTATFTLFGVTPADAGTYRCSYRPGGSYFLSSPLGDNVTLKVTPGPAHPGGTEQLHGNMLAAVAGGCAATLVFILVLIIFFLLAARRRRMWTDASPRMPEAVLLQVSVCVSQPQIPICPLGPQTQLGNHNPCPWGAHKTPRPKWLTTTLCAPPNPAHWGTQSAPWGLHRPHI